MVGLRPVVAGCILLVLCGACTPRYTPPPSPTTKTVATTRAVLQPIEARFGIYLARVDVHTTITPDGVLRSVRIENKSYGPHDMPGQERVEVRAGRLSDAQVADVAAIFKGWQTLSAKYGAVPDDAMITIRFGEKTVSGGYTGLPPEVRAVEQKLRELGRSMPLTGP